MTRARRRAGTLLALLLCASAGLASDLAVDPRSTRMNGLVTISLTVEGSAAEADAVDLPLQNLVLVGEPWVSSEFAWINGDVSRRKSFRYRARPIAPGPARVGPVLLAGDGGRVERLEAVTVEVTVDEASESNDAGTVLRQLLASGREPVFVVAELDRTEVFVGEPVVVEWMLYNAANLHRSQVSALPDLADFWSEELSRKDEAERAYVGDLMMQKTPVRRSVLFPLRSGRLRVQGLSVDAAVVRPGRTGPFGTPNEVLVDASFISAPFEIDVKPLPEGPPVDAVGDLTLTCSPPAQKNGGPVIVDVALAGPGNLRAAVAPRISATVDGTVRVENGSVTSSDFDGRPGMTRRWRYVIFPARTGVLLIPPVTARVFSPARGARMDLACEQRLIEVTTAAVRPAVPPAAAPPPAPSHRIPWPWIGGLAFAVLAIALAWPAARRNAALRREVRAIVDGAGPAEIRERVERRLGSAAATILAEPSDRGDSWRALRSLLDAAERDRDIAIDAEGEIARRTRDLLANL